MKKILITLLSIFIFTNSFADSIPEREFKQLEKEYTFLKEQTKELQKSIKEEREAHYNFVEPTIAGSIKL